jgi:hypothetical protein
MLLYIINVTLLSKLYGPSMMSQEKTPWKGPKGLYSFCGGILEIYSF